MTDLSGTYEPVRLCCGQRHGGVTCPDGKVMCCHCFDRFEVADLHTYPGDDKPSNVCKPCAASENLPQDGWPSHDR